MSASRTCGRSRSQQLQRRGGRLRDQHAGPGPLQRERDERARVGVVVHDQDADAVQRRGRLRRASGCSASAGSSTASPAAGVRKGSVTSNSAPPASPLRACTDPPCSSTMWRTMARPRPRPPWRRVLEASACRKRSKTCGRKPGSMPGPSSATVTARAGAVRVQAHARAPAARGELDRVGEQVQHHLLQPAGVAHDGHRRGPAGRPARRSWPPPPGARSPWRAPRLRARSMGRGSRRSLPATMRETSRMSEMSCSCTRALRPMTSIGAADGRFVGQPLAQDLGPAHDRVERRAQLVRQRGQELVLQAVHVLGLGARRLLAGQHGGHARARVSRRSRHVLDRAHDGRDLAVVAQHGDPPPPRSSGHAPPPRRARAPGWPPRAANGHPPGGSCGSGDGGHGAVADQRLRRPAHQPRHGRVASARSSRRGRAAPPRRRWRRRCSARGGSATGRSPPPPARAAARARWPPARWAPRAGSGRRRRRRRALPPGPGCCRRRRSGGARGWSAVRGSALMRRHTSQPADVGQVDVEHDHVRLPCRHPPGPAAPVAASRTSKPACCSTRALRSARPRCRRRPGRRPRLSALAGDRAARGSPTSVAARCSASSTTRGASTAESCALERTTARWLLQRLPFVGRQDLGRGDHHRQGGGGGVGAQAAQHLLARQSRHDQVQEDGFRRQVGQSAQRVRAPRTPRRGRGRAARQSPRRT